MYEEEVETLAGREAASRKRERVDGLFRHEGLFLPRESGRRRRLGAGRGRVRFLDPLDRSGVLLALKSGQLAAEAMRWLAKGDTSARPTGRGANFNRGVDRMRRLVCEYYSGFSFGEFVRNYPDLRGTVTDLLIGDLFDDRVDKVWRRGIPLPAGKVTGSEWTQGSTSDAGC